ncbi:hypothetical protein ACVIW0_007440 [Bradyrhizobium sp. USDA 4454]
MDGWLVTVAIKEDDDEYRHRTYAVADQRKAVKLALKDSGAKAAMVNCPLENGML